LEHEGTLERFTGDGMMIFNDPVPVANPGERAVDGLGNARACRGADREMAQARLRARFPHRHRAGYATIGAIGFEGRWDYGAIGPVTNLAARRAATQSPARSWFPSGSWR
jgi:class 3 adenylate cyclase